jgi:hypothetical protein
MEQVANGSHLAVHRIVPTSEEALAQEHSPLWWPVAKDPNVFVSYLGHPRRATGLLRM